MAAASQQPLIERGMPSYSVLGSNAAMNERIGKNCGKKGEKSLDSHTLLALRCESLPSSLSPHGALLYSAEKRNVVTAAKKKHWEFLLLTPLKGEERFRSWPRERGEGSEKRVTQGKTRKKNSLSKGEGSVERKKCEGRGALA